MLNIPELERRWFRYKIKSYIPYLSIIVSLVVIVVVTIFFYSSKKRPPALQAEKNVTQIPAPKPPKQAVKTITKAKVVQSTRVAPTPKNIHQKSEKKRQQKLTPSLDFMKRMQNSLQPYYKVEEEQVVTPKIEKKAPTKATAEEVVQPSFESEKVPVKITIKRENTQNDIRNVIKRFKHNNNPALSLFVAKKSYELGDYTQAYNYALITNRINSDIESSWIIFAKSLVKLGKKEAAITTLKKYIHYSNSSNAKILLNNITSGKFR